MSIFSELLPEIKEISKNYVKNIQNDLQNALDALEKFGDQYKSSRGIRARETLKSKNPITLQSIDEDEPGEKTNLVDATNKQNCNEIVQNVEKPRLSKKRSKDMVDGAKSPEQEKRIKRNASAKAQDVISKQVNINLSKKMRREGSAGENKRESRSRKKRNDKENTMPLPIPLMEIKLERVSVPQAVEEPMEYDSIPVDINIKQEVNKDDICMPPPIAPVPKTRKAKERHEDKEVKDVIEEKTRRSTRSRKQTDTMPSQRASSRQTGNSQLASTSSSSTEEKPPSPEARPKRTRAKKKQSEQPPEKEVEAEKQTEKIDTEVASTETTSSRQTGNSQLASTCSSSTEEKPPSPEARPKRTRAKKKQAEQPSEKEVKAEKQTEKIDTEVANTETSPPPQEKARPKRTRKAPAKLREMVSTEITESKSNPLTSDNSQEETVKSPILQPKLLKKSKSIDKTSAQTEIAQVEVNTASVKETPIVTDVTNNLNETIIVQNRKYDHAPETPKAINMNETVIIERAARSTLVLQKQDVNETIVISKETSNNLTEDDSVMTEDNSDVQETPPKTQTEIIKNPPSAVKEKVQQFEEIASRVTRTKTRAMVKKGDENENQTPPDKIGIQKASVISAETLNKMNNIIFNGKHTQVSASATKATPVFLSNCKGTSSTTKISAIAKMREREEEIKREKEDARKKKEAMLEAKKELQRRKREEKMAAAAAVRSAAEKERLAQIHLAEKERQERFAHLQQGKIEKQKEQERKKQELARKVAETEERRKAEEQARAQRLAEEHKRADGLRKRQQEEAEALKKEAAIAAKELEKRQKEYIEKQKLKQKLESDKVSTPLRHVLNNSMCNYPPISPVYMEDGFEDLKSDSDDEQNNTNVPFWSQSKVRWKQLTIQSSVRQIHVDRLFSVRQHSVDLRALFPNIDKRALKRTSSAHWISPRRPN